MRDHPRVPALIGTYPLLGDGFITAGYPHTVDWVVDNAGQSLACDIETYGLGKDAKRLKCVTFATPRSAVVLDPRAAQDRHHIMQLLDAAPRLVFHNSPFDVPSLAANGLWRPGWTDKVIDLLVHARLAHPSKMDKKTLDALAQKHFGLDASKIKDMFRAQGYTIKEGFEHTDIDSPGYLLGAGKDGLVTARLLKPVLADVVRTLTVHPFQDRSLDKAGALAEAEDQQIVNQVALAGTLRGIEVDFDFADQYKIKNQAEMTSVATELLSYGVSPTNHNELLTFLDDQDALPPTYPRTPKTGRPSGAAENLETLSHPLAKRFVHLKQLSKVESYILKALDAADEHGRIHPEVQVLKAETGRQAVAGDLPYHQLPAGARGVLRFETAHASLDWAQQEPVIALNTAGDVDALLGYEDGSTDLYSHIAEYSRKPRASAKQTLLGSMFGSGYGALTDKLGLAPGPYTPASEWEQKTFHVPPGTMMPRFREAELLHAEVFKAIPRTLALMKTLKDIATQHRKIITVNGRITPIGMAGGRPRAHKGMNNFCQGSAYDQLKDTIVECHRQGLSDAIYVYMHDELGVALSAAPNIRRIMERPSERLIEIAHRVPVFRTDMAVHGRNWVKS